MKNFNPILVIALSIALFSCTPKAAEVAPAADSTAVMVSSSAAVENKADSTHKFIRTADLKFKVRSVIKSTYDIEDITARTGGFVTYTNLTSDMDSEERKDISSDSSLIVTRYTVSNTLTVRVPNTKLDTILKLISRNIVYLDYRIIKADDVALQLLSNDLTIKRANRNEARLKNAIDNRGKKLNETTSAEELLLNKQEQADNAKIANLSLRDQMNFSTVNLTIYQNQGVNFEKVAREKSPKQYGPSFGFRILDSLSNGWVIFEEIVVFLFNLWGIILLGFIGFFCYKLYIIKIKRNKNK
ncbi:MAG TPA: DUF4349 domain-containing protein [Paludibacter sp.]|nr:DUF4349 domain-containing protein [Paludibacter sp.]